MRDFCATAPNNSRAFGDQNYLRDLIVAVGPRVRPGDRLKTFLAAVATRAGLHPRVIRRAWQGDCASEHTITKLREAARHGIRDEASDLAFQLEVLAIRLRAQAEPGYQPHAVACDEMARLLRRVAIGAAVGNE